MDAIVQAFPAFVLVLCRIASFFVTAPIFSARNVPTTFKIGLSVFLALITFSLVEAKPLAFDGTYIVLLFKEILIGVLLGFIAYIFFTVVQIAGSFIDLQMGFSIANVIDPMTGAQGPVIGNLNFLLASLLFLSFNGHHYLIQAIVESYQWVPLSGDVLDMIGNGSITDFLLRSFATSFSLAFQLAAPIVAALFLVDAGLGILARAAPQFNMFVIGMPLKIIVGFLLLLLMIPGFVSLYSDLFQKMLGAMHDLLVQLKT